MLLGYYRMKQNSDYLKCSFLAILNFYLKASSASVFTVKTG